MASGMETQKRFTLIELIMIIMVVGIAMTFIIPLHQAKQREGWTKEAISIMQDITAKDIAYKQTTGRFASTLDSLQVETKSDYFTFAITQETIIATTTKAFGVEDVELRFELPGGPWHRNAKEEKDKFSIQPNWLPE